MKTPKVDERFVRSFDGTDIAYHVTGVGPSVLLANGLGGSWKAWKHQIAYFGDRYRFTSWDYRGLYRSGPPPDRDAVDVPSQARDALAVLDAEGVERTAVLGWSMGVQVALELFRMAPERVSALVLVNGVAGRPWETVLDTDRFKFVLPRALRLARAAPRLLERVTRSVVAWPETVGWAKRLGLAGRTLDEELWADLASSFAELDMQIYVRTLERLGEHDAWEQLETVDVPTLIVAGDRDAFTPRSAAERMAQRVRGAELLVVPGATHYVAVEQPELVNLRIEKFFQERGWPSTRVTG
jgi:pimeloyl-ACP methyl ester carboxylesterase